MSKLDGASFKADMTAILPWVDVFIPVQEGRRVIRYCGRNQCETIIMLLGLLDVPENV